MLCLLWTSALLAVQPLFFHCHLPLEQIWGFTWLSSLAAIWKGSNETTWGHWEHQRPSFLQNNQLGSAREEGGGPTFQTQSGTWWGSLFLSSISNVSHELRDDFSNLLNLSYYNFHLTFYQRWLSISNPTGLGWLLQKGALYFSVCPAIFLLRLSSCLLSRSTFTNIISSGKSTPISILLNVRSVGSFCIFLCCDATQEDQ